MPDATRPMAILDYRSPNHIIRFYACHWTARFKENSERSRQLSSFELSKTIYQFLYPEETSKETRHVVVLGDFNEEPYGLLENWLFAHRDRARSRMSAHYTDRAMERAYLYNCAWKLLGETVFHPRPLQARSVAGSYYRREYRSWHTFDQVIVSGSLLSPHAPYLDEASIKIAAAADIVPEDFYRQTAYPRNSFGTMDTPREFQITFP